MCITENRIEARERKSGVRDPPSPEKIFFSEKSKMKSEMAEETKGA